MQSGPVICGLVPNDCEPAATEHARCQTQGILQGPHALHCITLHQIARHPLPTGSPSRACASRLSYEINHCLLLTCPPTLNS